MEFAFAFVEPTDMALLLRRLFVLLRTLDALFDTTVARLFAGAAAAPGLA